MRLIAVTFEGGTVDRRFSKKWATSGAINLDALPDLMRAVLSQRAEMVEYIEKLHDTIDFIIKTNKCCDVDGCFSAGCTSSHK